MFMIRIYILWLTQHDVRPHQIYRILIRGMKHRNVIMFIQIRVHTDTVHFAM